MSHISTLVTRILLALGVLALVAGSLPASAAPAQKPAAIIVTPVSHNRYVMAQVKTQIGVKRVQMHLDGRRITPAIQWNNAKKVTVRYPLTRVTAGVHLARLTVWDRQNHTTKHQWQVKKLEPPALSADKAGIKPGDTVTLTGSGFMPGSAVSVSLGRPNTGAGGNYGSAIADSNGRFSLVVTLMTFPNGTALTAGPVVLVAHNADSSEKATAQIQIQANPSLTAHTTSIKPGDRVTLSGVGFTPGARLIIGLGSTNTGVGGDYGAAIADAQGHFSLDVVPAKFPDGTPLYPGTIMLVAHNTDGREKAMVELQVQPVPALSASKSSIKPGDTVTLTGAGYVPGTTVSVSLGGVNTGASGNYGTVPADSRGQFSLNVTLARYPNGSPLTAGSIVLVAASPDFQQKATVQLQVLANPAISVNKESIKPGDRIGIVGTGFTPGAVVSVSMGAIETGTGGNYGTTVADSQGRISLDVAPARYPDGSALRAGTVVLLAHTADFSESAVARVQVVVTPIITLDRATVQPGDRVVVSGEGFTPGSIITISLGRINAEVSGVYGSVLVGSSGNFALPVTLSRNPDGSPLQPGTIVLVAHDGTWTQHAAAQIGVQDGRPVAPTDLQVMSVTKGATSAQPTTAALQWRDNSSSEQGFRIRATFTRMNGGTDTQAWDVPANTTAKQVSFVAGGINPVSKVCFSVAAFNGAGESSPSNGVCVGL